MEVGSIEIGARVNGQQLDSDLGRIKQNLNEAGDSAKSFDNDTKRMSSTLSTISKSMIGLGAAGLTTFSALASKSPATAGAMARIKVEIDKLSRSSGEIMKSAFEAGADGFQNFNNVLNNNKEVLSRYSETVVSDFVRGFGDLADVVNTVSSGITSIVDVISPKEGGRKEGIGGVIETGLDIRDWIGEKSGGILTSPVPVFTAINKLIGLFNGDRKSIESNAEADLN